MKTPEQMGGQTPNKEMQHEKQVEIEVGKRLPGLKLGDELPKDTKYWDQVIPSPYGELVYRQPQFRDTFIRWRTRDGKVTVKVSGMGIVISITKEGEKEE